MDEEQIERRGGDDRLDDDLAGAEPIELFAAVEQNLRGADAEAQRTEAEPVQSSRSAFLVLSVRKTLMPRKQRMPIGTLM